MSQQENIKAGFQRIVTELNASKSTRGDLTALSTTDKTNIVAAINEVLAAAEQAANSGGASINDLSNNSTTETWSITKIASEISDKIAEVVGAAPEALNTLAEFADALNDNDSEIASITTALANRLRFDAAQSLTTAQQQQARDNINIYSKDEIGNVDFDFVADIESTLS